MKDTRFALAFLFFSLLSGVLALAVHLDAQFIARDPGPRGGKVDAGQPVRGLTAAQQRFFNNALSRFLEVDSVGGNLPEETGKGLGPGFNGPVVTRNLRPVARAQAALPSHFLDRTRRSR